MEGTKAGKNLWFTLKESLIHPLEQQGIALVLYGMEQAVQGIVLISMHQKG